MSKSPTTYDLAKAAGVNQSTVSRTFNPNAYVSEKTRSHVLHVAQQIGYRRNPLVGAWMKHIRTAQDPRYRATLGALIGISKQKWKTIAPSQPSYTSFCHYAESQGYNVSPFFLHEKKALSHKRLSQVLKARNIPGLFLIIPSTSETQRHLNMDTSLFSFVTAGHTLLRPNVDRVCSNNYHGMFLALRIAQKKGYKRIAFLWHRESENKTDRAAFSAFASFLVGRHSKAKIALEHSEIKTGQMTPCFFDQWFKKYQPDLIIGRRITCNTIYKWKKQEIPQKFALVTLDRYGCSKAISGINQQYELSGEVAAKTLIAKVERNERGIPEHPVLHLVEGTWEEGKTTPALLGL